MVNTWFSSDWHLGHENIINYCKRPFKSLKQMNETIIRNHNQRVKQDDIVYFLGDFCFRNTSGGKKGEGGLERAEYFIKQLNGRFIFIKGNHDNNNSLKTNLLSCVIELGGQELFLVHNPKDGNKSYKINLCGHVHGLWRTKKKYSITFYNVGVDVNNFFPVSINEVMENIKKDLKKSNK